MSSMGCCGLFWTGDFCSPSSWNGSGESRCMGWGLLRRGLFLVSCHLGKRPLLAFWPDRLRSGSKQHSGVSSLTTDPKRSRWMRVCFGEVGAYVATFHMQTGKVKEWRKQSKGPWSCADLSELHKTVWGLWEGCDNSRGLSTLCCTRQTLSIFAHGFAYVPCLIAFILHTKGRQERDLFPE